MEKKAESDSLFAVTEYREKWWGKRVYYFASLLCIVGCVFALYSEGSLFPQWKETVKLVDTEVLTFRPDQKTSDGTPQLVCKGKICPVMTNEVNCYNEGADKQGKMKWTCKADMGFYRYLYALNESTVVCLQGCRSPDYVVHDSCYLVFSMQNIGSPKIWIFAFVLFVLFMGYAIASMFLNYPAPSQEKGEKTTSGKTTRQQSLQNVPECSEDSPTTNENETTENGTCDEAGETERDPWSDISGEKQRSLMFWRGYTGAFCTVLLVAVAIGLVMRVQTLLMPKSTKTFIIS